MVPPLGEERGFSLTEVMAIVAIVSVLALIAIPTFLGQRERAWHATVESDLRNAAVGMYTFYASEERYPVAGELTLPTSQDVTLTIALPGPSDDGSEFCIEGRHASLGAGVVATYDSRTGGFGASC